MLAYEHIGDVLGNPDLQNLGDRPGALRAFRQAADVGKRLYELDRSDQSAASDYGIVLSRVETAMDDNDFLQKLAVQRESLRVLDEAVSISPDNVTLQVYRALVHLHLGDTLTAAGKVEDARLAYLDSAAIAEPSLKLGHASLLVLFMRCEPASRVERRHPGEADRRAGVRRTGVAHKGESVGRCPVGASRPARVFGNGADLCGAPAEPGAAAGRPGGRSVLAAQSCRRVAGGSVR